MQVVLLEDDPLFVQAMQVFLRTRQQRGEYPNVVLHVVDTPDAAAAAARALPAAALLVDVHLHGRQLDTKAIATLRAAAGNAPIYMHSVLTDAAVIVRAMRAGATDYVPKHEGFLPLFALLMRSQKRGLSGQSKPPSSASANDAANAPADGMIGGSGALRALRSSMAACKQSLGNVLIYGEPGCGKELVARALAPRNAPFVAVDAAMLDDSLASGLLFGTVRGAYTGADRDRPGLFEQADGGTLYLDEVANLSLLVQAKLLRALQEREVSRLGCAKRRPVRIRFLAATHVDLSAACRRGAFRYDLLTRLQVFTVQVPALRRRREDIPPLFRHFVRQQAPLVQHDFDPALWPALSARPWYGNVRELCSAAIVAVARAAGAAIVTGHLPPPLPAACSPRAAANVDVENQWAERGASLTVSQQRWEQHKLTRAYEDADGNVSQMARELDVDRSHLHAKLQRLGIHTARRARRKRDV